MILEAQYQQRRKNFLARMSHNSVAVFLSASNKTRSNDTHYPYRQESNFYYLSGFKEDNAALVFVKTKESTQIVLFVQKKDETLELWNGKRLGEKEAQKLFRVDKVYVGEDFTEKLKEFLKDKNKFYYDFACEDARLQGIKSVTQKLKTHVNASALVAEMRLIKSDSEVELIKQALKITKIAHHKAMKFEKQGKHEYELQAEIEYIFKKNGASSDAYTSIVACGNSANTLHYIENDKVFEENELVLIDAGCEFDYYASDITRTIPVSGKFTEAQKELYNMVLDVQLHIIDMIKPHAMKSALQEKAEELLCRGMIKLGILKGNSKELLKEKAHKKYYPHGIGHWMGLDVHDSSPYRYDDNKEIPFLKGMVLTIEPGIYIDKDDKNVPAKYRGIGIRIEDNILVTSNGHKNLSKKIAKSIEEIEALSR